VTGSLIFRLALYFFLVAAIVSCSGAVLDAEEVSTAAMETRTPELGAPDVESIEFTRSGSGNGLIQAIVRGQLPDSCSALGDVVQSRVGNTFRIVINADRLGESPCTQTSQSFEEVIDLETFELPAGTYEVIANGQSGSFTVEADNGDDQGNAALAGLVWHDSCNIEASAETGGSLQNCREDESGTSVANGVIDSGEEGLGGLIVNLGQGSCPARGLATTVTDADGIYLFGGLNSGNYCISIESEKSENAEILNSGRWTFPGGDEVAQTTVLLSPGETKFNQNFGWGIQKAAEVVVENTQVPRDCTNKIMFVADVTIPDDTEIKSEETFTKTWRLQNNGTCVWDSTYSLVLVDGDQMGAAEPMSLDERINPGETVNLSVDLIAPEIIGAYRGDWMLRSVDDQLFGLGSEADVAFWVQIVVSE
jgi:hypothetical protein